MVTDEYTMLKFKGHMALLALLILASIYLAVCVAWLWPPFPYPGVAWKGEPWVNFRQWVPLTVVFGLVFAYILAQRARINRDIRKNYGEKTATTKPASLEIKASTMSEARVAEIAEEVYEDRKNREG